MDVRYYSGVGQGLLSARVFLQGLGEAEHLTIWTQPSAGKAVEHIVSRESIIGYFLWISKSFFDPDLKFSSSPVRLRLMSR